MLGQGICQEFLPLLPSPCSVAAVTMQRSPSATVKRRKALFSAALVLSFLTSLRLIPPLLPSALVPGELCSIVCYAVLATQYCACIAIKLPLAGPARPCTAFKNPHLAHTNSFGSMLSLVMLFLYKLPGLLFGKATGCRCLCDLSVDACHAFPVYIKLVI